MIHLPIYSGVAGVERGPIWSMVQRLVAGHLQACRDRLVVPSVATR